MERRFSIFIKNKLKAFTLLECLVSLLVISGSISVYNGLTKLLSSHVQALMRQEKDSWLLFCQQFRWELELSKLEGIRDNKLYINRTGRSLAFGQYRAGDFRKTNADGRGYQPMLTRLKSATFRENASRIQLDVVFNSGLERTFIYDFENQK